MPVNGVIEGAARGRTCSRRPRSRRSATPPRRWPETAGVQSVTSLISPTGDGSVPDAFVPSRQLETMADGFVSSGGGAKALLEPKVTTSLQSAADYVGALASPFPDVASSGGVRDRAVRPAHRARPDRAASRRAAWSPRSSARWRRPWRARPLPGSRSAGRAAGRRRLPAGAGCGVPGHGEHAGNSAARGPTCSPCSGRPRRPRSPISRRRSRSLATTFDAQPDAVLFPQSLPASAQATALQQQIVATFGRLPADLRALAAQYAALPDDLFIPTTLAGEGGAQVQAAVAAYLSDDGTVTRLFIITSDDPYSIAAFDTVRRARETAGSARDRVRQRRPGVRRRPHRRAGRHADRARTRTSSAWPSSRSSACSSC